MTYNPLNEAISRRKFLSYALKGAVGLVVYSTVGQLLTACSPEPASVTPARQAQVKQTYKIADVRNGLLPPEVYVKEKTASMPEVREKQRVGMLREVLYGPTDEEISRITEGIMIGRGYPDGIAKAAAAISTDAYRDVKSAKNHLLQQPHRLTCFLVYMLLFTWFS